MDLQQIQTMIYEGKFNDVPSVTDELGEHESEGNLYKSVALAMLGELDQAELLADISYIEAKDENIPSLQFAALVAKAIVKVMRSDPEVRQILVDTYSYSKQLSKEEKRVQFWLGYLFFIEGIHHFSSGDTHTVKEYLDRLQEVLEELESNHLTLFSQFLHYSSVITSGQYDQEITPLESLMLSCRDAGYQLLEGYVSSAISAYYVINGDFEKFKRYFSKAGEIWTEINYGIGKVFYQGGLGLYYLNTSDLDQSMTHYQKALHLSQKMGSAFLNGSFYRFIGEVHYRKGELREALENYQRSLKLRQEQKDLHGIAESYSHIGKVYQNFGDLELALVNYQQGLDIRQNIHSNSGIAASYDLLGSLSMEMNELDAAQEYFQMGLVIKRKLGNQSSIAASLFNLIRVSLAQEGDDATSLLDELQAINTQLEDKLVRLYSKLAEAMFLMQSTRGLRKSQAQLMLLEIAEEEVIDHKLLVLALVNLTELLLWELQASGDAEVLVEINEIISNLLTIAESQNIPELMIECHLFQSKLALLNLDVEAARDHLKIADEIALDRGFRYLAITVSNEWDNFLVQVEKWKDIADAKIPLDQVVELTRFERILKRVDLQQQAGTEEPVMLLILGEGGTNVFSHKFTELDINEELVGSFLSAIDSFGKETFSQVGSIERIIHQDYTILIKAVGEFLFCYVIRGPTYSAIQRLDTFVDTVRASTMWNELVGAPYRVKVEYIRMLERISRELFEGEQVIQDGEEGDQEGSMEKDSEYIEVSKELLDYKFLLNPIRLSIVKVLDTYFRYPAAELRKLLHIPWGTFNDHVEALTKKGYIETKKEFIDQNALNVLYFTSSGASEYSILKGLLQTHITG